MPIKVCFVQLRSYAVFQPNLGKEFGGAEVQFYLLAKALAKDPEFEVTCVARDYGQPDGEVIEGVRHHKIAQGGVILGKVPGLNKALSARGLYQTLERIDADIYLQRCAAVETGVVALYGRRHGKLTLHFVSSDMHTDGRFEKEKPIWVSRPYVYGIKNCTSVICQNHYQQEHVQRQYGREGQVIPSLCEVTPEYKTPQGDSVLWVSRCLPMKQPEALFDLARAFPDTRFVMIMNEGVDRDYTLKTTQRAKAIQNIELIDYVPYAEVERYYAEARVHVNTSTFEGFPNTFLQAMKFGVPVLSLSVNPDEVLTNEEVGFCAGGDRKQLQAGLQVLLSDNEIYGRMSRRAYDYVATHHDIQKLTEGYKTMLRDLVKAHSAEGEVE